MVAADLLVLALSMRELYSESKKIVSASKVSIVRTGCLSHQRSSLLEIFFLVTTDSSNVLTVDRLPSLIFIIFWPSVLIAMDFLEKSIQTSNLW